MSRSKHIYLPQEVQEEVQRVCDRESRSFSWMVRQLIKEALEARAKSGAAV